MQPAGVDAASWNRLRTGRLAPERTLDLHGRTAHAAFHALAAFLHRAQADRVRCVEIITGRGEGAGGVIRRELPLWLNLAGAATAGARRRLSAPGECGRGAAAAAAVAMTPFGARLRALRAERRTTQKALAAELASRPPISRRWSTAGGARRPAGWCIRSARFFGLIWDDADELARLARLSHPRVRVNTSGLTPEQTALANRLSQAIHRLPPETVAAMHALLDQTSAQPKPRLRRAAGRGR